MCPRSHLASERGPPRSLKGWPGPDALPASVPALRSETRPQTPRAVLANYQLSLITKGTLQKCETT